MKYLESGYAVIPLDGQKPIINEWSMFSTELPTEEHIDNWRTFEVANIGLVCGKASGVIAFDYDYIGSEHKRIETIVNEIIPPSPVRKFGLKGWTGFYRYNGIASFHVDRCERRMFDFISDGKQTVLPPSIHPKSESGIAYTWLTEDTLLDVNPKDLPEITQDMLDKLIYLADLDFSTGDNPFGKRTGRHDIVVSYAMAIADTVNSIDELADKMVEYDLKKHADDPYFSDKKYFKNKTPLAAAKSIAVRVEKSLIRIKKNKGVNWKIGKVDKIVIDIGGDAADGEVVGPGLDFFFNEYPGNWYREEVVGETIKHTPDYIGMASTLKQCNLFKTIGEVSYTYGEGYWSRIGDTAFDSMIFKLTKNAVKPNHINGFRRTVKAVCYSEDHDSANDGLLNLRNGVLDIKTGNLLKHSNKYLFFNRVEVDYNADAKCDLWLKYLNETFGGDTELIDLAQEIFGYTILGGAPFLHRAFVLFGSGRNGKSTFIDVFKHILGYGATSVGLKLLDKPFSVVNLDGKIANLIEETPSGHLNAEEFKAAVGGGYLTAAQKGEPEYQLKIKARFVFACNKMPTFDDKEVSLLDRLSILPFNNYLKEGDRDYFLPNKLKAEDSGIINWALVGAKRVSSTIRLTLPAACVIEKEAYREDNDPLYAWFKDNIELNKDARELSSKSLYKAYCWDMEAQNNRPLSLKGFGKRFSNILREKSGSDVPLNINYRENGKKTRGYTGINYIGEQSMSRIELNF